MQISTEEPIKAQGWLNSKGYEKNEREREAIAVIGMACRFPSANNLYEFWNLLQKGKSAIQKPPSYRWTKQQYPYLPKGIENVQAGFLSVPIDGFDAKFFKISPVEAAAMDPQHRILLEVVWESFEDAGINPEQLRGTRGGVFLGSWLNQYKEILQVDDDEGNFYRNYKGTCVGVGAARISQLLGWTGPCQGTESDCSASLTSVSNACKNLQNNDCNIAVACGVNILVTPFTVDNLPAVLSPDFICKTFDESANGFARAEGAGALVLKRYSDAVQDGDRIWGLIRGSAVSQEGMNSSLGTPTVSSQVEAMELALKDGAVDPAQVSYVEAHGTGTKVGDPVEMEGISKIYGKGIKREGLLTIGSVKTNLGHTESSSGIAGLIKVLLSMENEAIPPHINFNKLNPKINLVEMKAKLPLELIPWPRVSGKPRIAGVSSFGLAGKNCHVVVEEPPKTLDISKTKKWSERPIHILKITAKTPTALDALVDRHINLLREQSDANKCTFADLAYTANIGRTDFSCRAAVIAEDFESAEKLLSIRSCELGENLRSNKICFLFTGQGSQYQGMAKELYETLPIFQSHFDFCEEWLQSSYNISILDAFFKGTGQTETVNRTLYSQTGIFIVEYCLLKVWESWGVKPGLALGHSLGELCAAVCAGIMEIEEALMLVAERSILIDNLPPGKMLVVKANKETVDSLRNEFLLNNASELDYAAFNSDGQTVVAGCPNAILAFETFLGNKGLKSTLLQSTHAFHSKDMDPILEKYHKIAEKIQYKQPAQGITYISGMFGKPVKKIDANYWVRHTRDPVNFIGACQYLWEKEENLDYLEIGPHPVLSALVMMNKGEQQNEFPGLFLASLRKSGNDLKTMFTSLGKLYVQGVDINWAGIDENCSRKKVGNILPTYPFQRNKYWPTIPSNSKKEKILHPLLGWRQANPTSTIVFQAQIPSSSQQLEYLKDHKIGEKVIFPGAGYIEMMLAAGAAYFNGGCENLNTTGQVQLQNFKILFPLELSVDFKEERPTCQTIITRDNEMESKSVMNNFKASIFRQCEKSSNTSWTKHASATLQGESESFLNNSEEELQMLLDFNKKDKNQVLIAKLTSTLEEESLIKSLYEPYSTVGLNFGETFRTLQRVWKCWKSHQFLAKLTVPESKNENYLLHPIIIDAMMQVTGFPHFDKELSSGKKPNLLVPVGCKRFIWMKPLTTKQCFIYSPNLDHESSLLLDGNGELVALLYKVSTASTTVDGIKAVLDSEKQSIPMFYEYKWVKTGSTRHFNFKTSPDGVDLVQEASKTFTLKENYRAFGEINKLAFLFITKALLKLGWAPKEGVDFQATDLCKSLGILEKHKKLLSHFLTILEEEKIIKKSVGFEDNDESFFVKTKLFPDLNLVEVEIQRILKPYQIDNLQDPKLSPEQISIGFLQQTGETLDTILIGGEEALPLLYPKSPSKNTVTAPLYYEVMCSKINLELRFLLSTHWKCLKSKFKETNDGSLPTVRILEVGAGTGAVTSQFLETLEDENIPFEYVYTDISSSFFPAAEEKFAKFRKHIIFKKLNLEVDPTSQGFPPGYFDVVVAVHVIHATKDIKETLLNIRKLMVDGGNLWMSETVENDRILDCTFGLLDGFWRFADLDLRPDHCMLSVDKWKIVTQEMGFSHFHHIQEGSLGLLVCRADQFGTCKSSSMELQKKLHSNWKRHYEKLEGQSKWLVFFADRDANCAAEILKYFDRIGKNGAVPIRTSLEGIKKVDFEGIDFLSQEKQWNINGSEIDYDVAAEITSSNVPIEGIIVTWALHQVHSNKCQEEVVQLYLKFLQALLKLSGQDQRIPPVFLLTNGLCPVGDTSCPDPFPSALIGMSIAAINENRDLSVRILDLDPAENIQTGLSTVLQEVIKNFEDIPTISVFREGNQFSPKFATFKPPMQSLNLPANFTKFQLVLPTTQSIQDLQFKVMNPFSKLKNNEIEVKVVCSALNFRDVLCVLKPSSYFANRHNIGVDFAGVIAQVGSSVKKWKLGDEVFGIHSINQPLISHVRIEEDQVDSIPANFTFAEAASLPLVFSTAHYALVELGRARKGQTILIHAASGGVGLAAIQIAKELGLRIICTAGNERKRGYLRSLGISHVFNSRTTDFSKEILNVLEGKGVDLVLNSITGPGLKEATLEACAVGAHFIEISKLNIFNEEEMAELRPDVKYSIIDPSEFEKILYEKKYTLVASEWMKNKKIQPIPYTRFDVGDIRDALTYLQKANHIGKVVISMPDKTQSNGMKTIPLFNERSTYLITGGLGGIGLQVCKYMVEQGARYIVLIGRNPPTREVSVVLECLKKEHCCRITVLQGDVGSMEDCKRIFQHIDGNLPHPLRGVMHSAGTLSDGRIENLSWKDFQKTFRSKVEGSWNLHELTKELNLEHFVLFSSVAAKLAPAGQASHISACTFQDTLAHYRNNRGLPATTINWGQWAEVGVAKNLELKFILPFSLQQGIRSLDLILRKNLNSVTVVNLNKNLGPFLDSFPYMKGIIDRKILQISSSLEKKSSNNNKINSEMFWEEYSKCGETFVEKLQVSRRFLEQLLRNVLRLGSQDSIHEDTDLSVMGMDSLMMIELVNLMQALVGKRLTIPQGLTKDCKTFKSLASRLVEIIEEKWKEVSAPSLEEVRDLSVLDIPLPLDIQVERPGSDVAPSQIKTLLLTGATGFVGSHLLKELLESCPQLERIYCLVRGDEPMNRELSVFERNRIGLDAESLQKRVHFITGDFTLVNLGLPEEEYLKKCEEVDGIFHLGAMVHHSDYYRNVPGGSKDVRSVNVGGLLNILRFACKGKTKHVFYTSTLFTTSWNTGEDGRILETWPSLERLTSLGTTMGYPISKMICELHLKQAVEERGIPVKVFRCCTFRAPTTSGKSFAEGTHLMRVILFALKEGFVSNDPTPINVVPVDVAVKIMTSLSFNDEAPNEVFHLSHPRPLLLRDCIPQLAEDLGRPMTMMNTEDATQRLLDIFETAKKNFEKDGTAAALKKAMIYDLRLIYQDKNLFNFLQNYGNEAWEGWKECEEFWTSRKLERFVPEVYSGIEHPLDILKRDVKAAIQEGLLD